MSHGDSLERPVSRASTSTPSAASLCRTVPVVSPADTNAKVSDLFDRHRELISLPVVDNTGVHGMIKRSTFQSEMAKPFRHELKDHKSCVAFMDPRPLVVEADTSIEQTTLLVAESESNALADGFLVVSGGEYLGIALGLDLMRMVADQHQAKNRQLMESIDYASVIQRAMLHTSHELLKTELPDSAIVWEPRDIVGGDFYLCAKFDKGIFIAMADCTGHSVPGAFMTLISSSWLAQALERDGPSDPAKLLGMLNRRIKRSLGQVGSRVAGEQSDDGLDALFLWLDLQVGELTYAGARMPLHVLPAGDEEAATYETDRMGIGYVDTPTDHGWQNRTLAIRAGDLLCVATDGLSDQVGGARNISFGKRRLRDLLVAGRGLSATEHASAIARAHGEYQGAQRRRDDVSFLCFRVPRGDA